jgi:hypothetical protein
MAEVGVTRLAILILFVGAAALMTGCAGNRVTAPVPAQELPRSLAKRIDHGWWASEPLSVAEIENENLSPDAARRTRVAFGTSAAEWAKLKTLMQPGDILVRLGVAWQSPLGGVDFREGYALVRDGLIIAEITTKLS